MFVDVELRKEEKIKDKPTVDQWLISCFIVLCKNLNQIQINGSFINEVIKSLIAVFRFEVA